MPAGAVLSLTQLEISAEHVVSPLHTSAQRRTTTSLCDVVASELHNTGVLKRDLKVNLKEY